MRVEEHTIDLAGSPVFFRSAEGPLPPVLYLHGVPTSADDWTAFLERTGGVAPDLIGFGRSGKGGHLDLSPDGHADFLEALLERLGIGRVRLVVHDWGAAGGVLFAARDPTRVVRLVMFNAVALFPGLRPPRLARVWRRPVVGELAMGATTRWLLARALRRGAAREQAWPPGRVATVWEHFDQGTQRAILRLHRQADERFLARAAEAVGRLTIPALLVWGAGDPWLSPAVGEAYERRMPEAELRVVPDAGHWPWLDRPELIEQVGAFLEDDA